MGFLFPLPRVYYPEQAEVLIQQTASQCLYAHALMLEFFAGLLTSLN